MSTFQITGGLEGLQRLLHEPYYVLVSPRWSVIQFPQGVWNTGPDLDVNVKPGSIR